MNFEDVIWDVKHILGALKPGTRVLDGFLMNKINNYRTLYIISKFGETGRVDPSWVQNTGKLITTKVNSADNPEFEGVSIDLSKCTLPNVISLPDDAGEYRITGSSGQGRIYKTTADNLYLKITGESEDLNKFHYYFRVEDAIFIYPLVSEIMAFLVQDNPLQSPTIKSEYILSGDLELNKVYEVVKGTIIYNGTGYTKGQTFTCAEQHGNEFTGNGMIKLVTKINDRTFRDNYPISRDIAQMCVLDVLQKEYQLEMKFIQDVIEDNQDQFKLLRSQ